ncbi:MAG: outer membrane protein assembly factor BamD [Nitrospinota bacterium]|nr:outer membrane protein assembly factor BamD [Nitrospinota bacterium]
MNPIRTHFQIALVQILLGLFWLGGCSGISFQSSKDTPQELVQKAMEYIRAENFVDAKAALSKVIEDYPDSPEKVMASLLNAEVHYKNEEYEESKFMFKSFIELYPAHRLADRAHFYMAMSDFQLMDLETRDQTSAQNALEEFDQFLKKYPDSKYRPQAQEKKQQCFESLARNQLEIGKFYFRTSSFQSAIVRFQQMMEAYPDQPFLDEVLFLLGESFYHEQNFEKAVTQYHELIRKFPRSEFVTEARARLREIQ